MLAGAAHLAGQVVDDALNVAAREAAVHEGDAVAAAGAGDGQGVGQRADRARAADAKVRIGREEVAREAEEGRQHDGQHQRPDHRREAVPPEHDQPVLERQRPCLPEERHGAVVVVVVVVVVGPSPGRPVLGRIGVVASRGRAGCWE